MYQPTLYLLDFYFMCGLRMLSAMTGLYIRSEYAICTEPPPYKPLGQITSSWDGRKLDLMGFDGRSGE